MKSYVASLIVLCLLLAADLAAQTQPADSLRALLQAEARTDTTRVRRLQALSNELMMADLPQAITVLEQALVLSRELGDHAGEGRVLLRLGTLYRRQDDFEKSRYYTQQALALFTRRADAGGLAKTYLQLSFIDNAQSNVVPALKAALTGLPFAEKAKDRVTQTRLQVAIGSHYVQLGSTKEAVPLLKQALANGTEQGDEFVVASALSLLGNAHQQQQKWTQALEYYRRSVQLNKKLGDLHSATLDETSVAELYAQQGDVQQALSRGMQARASAQAAHDASALPGAELALARANLLAHRLDTAIALARHNFALSHVTNRKENLRAASDILAQAYAERGQYADAYRYRTLWVVYNDSIAGEKTQGRTSALRYGYELDKKQDQISLLTQSRQLQAQKAARQRQSIYGLLAGVLGLLLLAGLLIRNVVLKQRANRTLNEKNEQIAHQRDRLDKTLTQLKTTQSQLVQSEKMVALAALTAGVAHEIQNPLNFVNNFSELSLELMTELEEEQQRESPNEALTSSLIDDLKQNLRKIHQHGGRASSIVKGMLEHGHAESGQRQAVDLNALCEEYLRLAYHGLQSRHRAFTVVRTLDLDPNLATLPLVPQEMGRVLLNLFTNAFYAVHQKALAGSGAYEPTILVRTRHVGGHVEISVRDNGLGIPAAAMDKIFDPFFTTKPPGEGTGLGLWLSYDIITNGYGGTLTANSEEGAFTEFVLTLPHRQTVSRPVAAATLQQ